MAESERKERLREAIAAVAKKRETVAYAVSVHDLESGFRFSENGGQLFHAASTIKVAILLALFKAVDDGRIRTSDPLVVRNRFLSAVDGTPFRLDSESDGYPQLYRSIGRTARISDLAESMIIWSSNLATNLLLDYVGTDYAATVLEQAGVSGVHLRRGVEDEKAHEQGMNNETTADGLVALFAALRGDFLSKKSREQVIHILLEQKFTSMLPAGLPAHATVAHKTGEISTACHDAGIVYLPEREPYIVAVLTQVDRDKNGKREAVKEISEAVYHAVIGKKGK
ncbi:MAG TPA: serine hydrolase [Chthoniobacterales bacterium]